MTGVTTTSTAAACSIQAASGLCPSVKDVRAAVRLVDGVLASVERWVTKQTYRLVFYHANQAGKNALLDRHESLYSVIKLVIEVSYKELLCSVF